MLESVSSRELTQWMAFEQIAGPVGQLYTHAALRQIASLLNGDEKAKPFPTPAEMAKYQPQQDQVSFDAVLEEG